MKVLLISSVEHRRRRIQRLLFLILILSLMKIINIDGHKMLIVITTCFFYKRNYIYITVFVHWQHNVPTIQYVISMHEMSITNCRCNNFMNLT